MNAYKARTAQIESSGGQTSSNIYQFQPGTWARLGGGDLNDRNLQEQRMDQLTAENMRQLTYALGRSPTPAELYLAHQQGAIGAYHLMSEPGRRAGDIVGDAAISRNGGDPNAPAGAFVAMWEGKFNRTTPQMAMVGPVGAGLPIQRAAYAPDLTMAPIPTTPAGVMPSMPPIMMPVPGEAYNPDAITIPGQTAAPAPTAVGLPLPPTGGLPLPPAAGMPVNDNLTAPTGQGLGPIPKNSILNALPPDKAAEMRLRGIQEVIRMQREDAMAMRKDDRADRAVIDNMIGGMVRGIIPEPDAMTKGDQIYGSAGASPQVQYDWAQAKQIRTMIQGMQGMPPAQVAATVAGWQAQVADQMRKDPFGQNNLGLEAIVKAGQQYSSAYTQEMTKNPYPRAAQDGVATFAPLDPNDPSTFAKRVQDKQAIDSHYGINAPLLTPDERKAMRKITTEVGGEPMEALSKNIVAGGGPMAYEFLRQIGSDAPAFWTSGTLQLNPYHDFSDTVGELAEVTNTINNPGAKKGFNLVTVGTAGKAGVNVGEAFHGLGTEDASKLTQAGIGPREQAAARQRHLGLHLRCRTGEDRAGDERGCRGLLRRKHPIRGSPENRRPSSPRPNQYQGQRILERDRQP